MKKKINKLLAHISAKLMPIPIRGEKIDYSKTGIFTTAMPVDNISWEDWEAGEYSRILNGK